MVSTVQKVEVEGLLSLHTQLWAGQHSQTLSQEKQVSSSVESLRKPKGILLCLFEHPS